MSTLLNQDINLRIDSKNNLNIKDTFAKAHEKVDEFFDIIFQIVLIFPMELQNLKCLMMQILIVSMGVG
jgi:hypothetical protein